jgi:hypothetical protein
MLNVVVLVEFFWELPERSQGIPTAEATNCAHVARFGRRSLDERASPVADSRSVGVKTPGCLNNAV